MSWATPYIAQMEVKYKLPKGLMGAIMRAESGGQKYVRSSAGAIGPMQLMPGTAHSLGVNPNDPVQNLEGGAKYLRQLLNRWNGDVTKTIASYNAGPGAVEQYGGVPPYAETKTYVKRVTGYMQEAGAVPMQHAGAQPALKSNVSLAQATPAAAQVDPGRISQIQNAWSDAPENGAGRINAIYDAADKAQAAAASQPVQAAANPYSTDSPTVASGPSSWYKTPDGFVRGQQAGEANYQFLQRLGQKGFGLRNDPGDTQTTGGHHAVNSWHYKNDAVDFGNGLNAMPVLDEWYNWLNAHKKPLGIVELLHESPGTSNEHIHVAKA